VAVPAEVITDDELAADIGPFAGKTFGAEVVRIVERSDVPGVKGTMKLHLLGDGGGILAEISGDVLKGSVFVQ
jgi:hypothetical protein